MTSYRVHTVVIGRNLPVTSIFQPNRCWMRCRCSALLLLADAAPIEDEMFQVIGGPCKGR